KMRAIVEAIVDRDSLFEIGALYGRAIITGFARLDGWPVALMASDPFFYGGAWTAATCQKVERFVDLAQTFHLPVVYLVDCPGLQRPYPAGRAAAPDPKERLAEVEARLTKLRSPFRSAETFWIEEIIDPRNTRPLLCEFADLAAPLRRPGPAVHHMRP